MRARLLALLLGVAGALGDEAGSWHRRWTVGSAKDKAREDTRFVANDGSESVRVVKAVRPTSRCLGRVGRARSFVSHIGQDKFIYKTFFEKAKKVCSRMAGGPIAGPTAGRTAGPTAGPTAGATATNPAVSYS